MDDYKKLYAHSWREAVYYSKRLNKELSIRRDLIRNSITIEDANNTLNAVIEGVKSSFEQEKLITDLISSFNQKEQLPDEELLHFKKGYRATNFIITFLSHHLASNSIDSGLSDELTRNKRGHINFEPFKRQVDRLPTMEGFIKHPRLLNIYMPTKASLALQKSRYLFILKAFKQSNINLEGQKYLIRLLNDLWYLCYSSNKHKKLVTWVERKNSEQIELCIDYLSKKVDGFKLPWKATNQEESYSALIAYFDYHLLMKPAETELLISKMKAAWTQKKFREKTSGKKPYSVSMSDRTKERLTWLVTREDSNISKVIKDLIDIRYENITNT